MDTATWIAIALLAPFWWGLGLLVLALIGDGAPGWHARASRLFDRLGRRQEPVEARQLPGAIHGAHVLVDCAGERSARRSSSRSPTLSRSTFTFPATA